MWGDENGEGKLERETKHAEENWREKIGKNEEVIYGTREGEERRGGEGSWEGRREMREIKLKDGG